MHQSRDEIESAPEFQWRQGIAVQLAKAKHHFKVVTVGPPYVQPDDCDIGDGGNDTPESEFWYTQPIALQIDSISGSLQQMLSQVKGKCNSRQCRVRKTRSRK
jgi:hypothetical protein